MRVVFLFVALFAAVWAYPQAKNKWKDFPMRHMFVDAKVVNDPKYHPGTRILRGTEVEPHEIPFQVWSIFRPDRGEDSWSCGGSLITRRYILTAAHCITGAKIAEAYIGVHDISSEEPSRLVLTATRLIRHPDYNSRTKTNDVGLIDLEQEVELSASINVARLPRRRDIGQLYKGENVRVSGWGFTDVGTTDVLLKVNSTVLANAQCKAIFSVFQESEICISGEGGVGACHGDSGGPLVAGDTLVGVVSYGMFGCLSGFPTVFARVTSFLAWIEENSDYKVED